MSMRITLSPVPVDKWPQEVADSPVVGMYREDRSLAVAYRAGTPRREVFETVSTMISTAPRARATG